MWAVSWVFMRAILYEKGPSQNGPSQNDADARLLDGVNEVLHAGLTVGSLVLVDDALGRSLIKTLVGAVGSGLGSLDVALGNGGLHVLDERLELGADRAVADAGLLSGTDTLLLRLDVCHFVWFLSIFRSARYPGL